MWLPASLLLVLYISRISADTTVCTTTEGKQGTCVLIDHCPSLLKTFVNSNLTRDSIPDLICDNRTDSVCCTEPRGFPSHTELSDRRYCGYQPTGDYYYAGSDTSIDEYPWLAAILATVGDTEEQKEVVICHGFLINNRYLLSAAQCFWRLRALRRYNITRALLGEYHRNTSKDCIDLPKFGTTECNEAEQFQIEETISHPFFSQHYRFADIALIRLNSIVTYSDYIRPICLPIEGTVFAKVGDVLYKTGWSLTTYEGESALIKKKVPTVLVGSKECQDAYKNYRHKAPAISYICTLDVANITEYSCRADAGAPVMFKHKNQWHVEGIVSSGKGCGRFAPGLQVRVSSHLEWIKQNIRP